MPLPILPKQQQTNPNPTSKAQFPPNVAATIPKDLMTRITNYLVSNYLLPQIMERRSYEPLWDELLQMYKMKMTTDNLTIPLSDSKSDQGSLVDRQLENQRFNNAGGAQMSDSVIYDAVDRLTNLNHFISWKDGKPIQFQPPKVENIANEDQYYFPTADKYNSMNGLLDWNIKNQDVYRKHLITCRHHYLYGISFVGSEFVLKSEVMNRQNNQGQMIQQTEITDIGITFEPISVRRIWLNYRLPVYDMKFQPCPFLFKAVPRFSVMSSIYHPTNNPFGYVNLDTITDGQWMFSAPEMEEARKAMAARIGNNQVSDSLIELVAPKFSVEALWSFYPMLPLAQDPQGNWMFEKDAQGKDIPFTRWIWQTFTNNLMASGFSTIRLQQNFYPKGEIPLFGSSHMPDLDSALYSPAIGEILENHFKELCTAANQYLDNKNLINDPPSWTVAGSPAVNANRNKPGADLIVNGPNDIGWKQVYDGTTTTVQYIQMVRDQAQTSSKAVDAILGKALGGRTSATEAANAFQAAMSGVTTDVNLFNYDIMGGYATRVFDYTGLWFNPDLIKSITGMYGTQLQPEDLWARVEMKWDVGSTYIESIVKQQSIQYVLQAAPMSPYLNGAILWRELFRELRMPELAEAIMDNGFEQNVYEASEQTTDTYMGKQVIIDPAQDQQVAMEVKMRYLKDLDSDWNVNYGGQPAPVPNQKGQPQSRAQYLAEQIQIHQQFALIQMQAQLTQQHLANAAAAAQNNKSGNADVSDAQHQANTAGQVQQQSGPMSQKG